MASSSEYFKAMFTGEFFSFIRLYTPMRKLNTNIFNVYFSVYSTVLLSSVGMREQEMREIKLHGVTKTGLKNVIDFIYTSKVSLDMRNLQDTLEAANFLRVMPVLSFCNQLLSSGVRFDSTVISQRSRLRLVSITKCQVLRY